MTDARSAAATLPIAAPRVASLRMDAEEFRRIGHSLVDSVASFLATLAERRVNTAESPRDIQSLLCSTASLPLEGVGVDTLLESTADLLFEHSLFNGHPRFFGYVSAPPAPIGMFGDFLAAAVNANVGSWRLAPVATEIETQTIRWIAELIGYPMTCGGLLVSGGNVANLVGLLAARSATASWDVRRFGVGGPRRCALRVYASEETHTWIQKATDLAGLGTEAIRWIATDERLRLNVAALRHAIQQDHDAGDCPMLVVATAGSVSTGAVDPLAEIAGICRDAGTWLHVDGAYGAFAAAVPGTAPDLRALTLADSVAVDPHKWLYAPLEVGCILVRDPQRLRNTFAYHPPYYHFGQEALNYVDFGPQNSRGFRALKVWLALRQAGRNGYVKMIADDIRLSERLHVRVGAHPELESFTQELSICTFRYVPLDLRPEVGVDHVEQYLTLLNRELLDRIQKSGEAFVSNAIIGGRFILRACIVNFHTSDADVDALPGIVSRLGRVCDAALRAPTRS